MKDRPRLYIAGPMTGIPDHNFPAFNTEAARLRNLGYEVENPAQDLVAGWTWSQYLRRALTQLLKCDSVVTLPDYNASRGACIEVNLARELSMPVFKSTEIML